MWTELNIPKGFKILITVFLSLFYIFELVKSDRIQTDDKRLKRLNRAVNLIFIGGVSAAAEIVLIIFYFIKSDAGTAAKILSVVVPLIMIGFELFAGVLKAAVSSKQIKISDYILMLTLWWCPIINIFLIRKFYKVSKREFIVERDKTELENARAENEICRTKYPILMVHGIFFRDWQLMNYWGRVPASLIRNGAKIYYGNQQSAQSVADSAEELKNTILKIVNETGAEKVNIIAHSKGGLDSRYAISRLGMDKYVATLTTINTPHKGCDMVDYLLEKLPDSFAQFLAAKYNSVFTKLGDTKPDFMAGVHDLSAVRAKSYDEEMPDSPNVSYRSRMSVMKSAGSAGVPLNIGYMLIKKLNGANDGLVWEESAKHGEYQLISNQYKRGISHGDVIDLFRENIEGYDVREYYVGLVENLKNQGY
ncbi:MAG: alpha/beta hydrolase [Ruminococcus sp.]|nr:alpha/beta hydrolase [Ruminococcus sp.]